MEATDLVYSILGRYSVIILGWVACLDMLLLVTTNNLVRLFRNLREEFNFCKLKQFVKEQSQEWYYLILEYLRELNLYSISFCTQLVLLLCYLMHMYKNQFFIPIRTNVRVICIKCKMCCFSLIKLKLFIFIEIFQTVRQQKCNRIYNGTVHKQINFHIIEKCLKILFLENNLFALANRE